MSGSTAADPPSPGVPTVPTVLFTVGHGKATAAEFGARLSRAGTELVVDVRRYPGSRKHPHFARDAMSGWLPELGIDYRWDERLGGRRRLERGAPVLDGWWTVEQFAAYAAHTRTPEFGAALAEVLSEATKAPTTVLCSETVWWRCHRRLIADVAVLLHGFEVSHLLPTRPPAEHRPAAGARVSAGQVFWDRAD